MGQLHAFAVAAGMHRHEWRHQDQSIEVHAVTALQVMSEAGTPDAAVAFPEHEFRRRPTPVVGDVVADESGHRLDVLIDTPEVLALPFADRSAESGSDRIDHDQVGHVEDAVGIVDASRGRGRRMAAVIHDDPLRAKDAHMQPQRRRSRAAVEREHDRAFGQIFDLVAVIGGIAEPRDGLVVLVLDHPTNGCRVIDSLTIDPDRVLGAFRDRLMDRLISDIFGKGKRLYEDQGDQRGRCSVHRIFSVENSAVGHLDRPP